MRLPLLLFPDLSAPVCVDKNAATPHPVDRMPRRFTPQKTKQRIPLFAQRAQSLPASTGVFAGNHPDIAGQRFSIPEPLRLAQEHFGRQSCDRPHSRMSHQPPCLRSLPCQLSHLSIQVFDLFLQVGIQRLAVRSVVRWHEEPEATPGVRRWPAWLHKERPRRRP